MAFIDRNPVKPDHSATAAISTSKVMLTDRCKPGSLFIDACTKWIIAMAASPLLWCARWSRPRQALTIAVEAVDQAWQATQAIRYGGCLFVIAAAVVAEVLTAEFAAAHPFILGYPATIMVAVVFGTGPGLLATLLAASCTALLSIRMAEPDTGLVAPDVIALLTFLLVGAAISVFCGIMQRGRRRSRTVLERALRDSEHRFNAMMEAVEDYAIFMLDPSGRVLGWNAAAERIKGWPGQEIAGRPVSSFFLDDAADPGEPDRRLAVAAAQGCFHEEVERVRKDGSRFWADVAIRAIRDDDGDLRGYAKVIRDVTDRVRAAHDRIEDQRRMTGIIEAAMDAIVTVDADQRIVQFNKAAEEMFLCAAAEVLGQPLARFIPQHARDAHARHIRSFAATGVTSRGMGRIDNLSALKSDGEEFPIEASISQAQVDGNPLYTVILRDITHRRRAEERQSLLLLELAHRVKNTLAIVQSVVAQTRRFASPEAFHKTLTGRLAALGAAHDLLTSSEWAGATLIDVVRFAFAPYETTETAGLRWTIDGPGIWLASNEAVTLSLVFHELATNAAKYGALSDSRGRVTVRWTLEPQIQPAVLAIHWLEREGPVVVQPSHGGFGSRLLEQAVSHDLDGETVLTFSPDGAECRLRLPLSAKVNMQ